MAIEASAANFFNRLGLNDCPIATLADKDLAALFKYLPPFQRLIVSEVCAKWRNISQTPWRDISHLDLSQVPTAYIHAVMKKCPNLTSVSTLRQHLGDFCRFASRLSNITSLKCVESTFTMDLNVPRRYDLEHSLEFATWSELIWHNSKSVVACSGASAREYLLPYGRPATLRRLQLSDVGVPHQEHINDVDRILHPSPLQLECFILAFANIPQNDYFHRFCFYAQLDYYLVYVTHLRELYLDAPDRFSLPELTRSLPELKILFLNNVILVEDTFEYFLTHHPSLCVVVITVYAFHSWHPHHQFLHARHLRPHLHRSIILSWTKQRLDMSVANPGTEKLQNLPLLCVETIWKFTPTSKLVRFYSDAVPLPGAFWSLGLKTVLKKRLPLCLVTDSNYNQARRSPTVILDAVGAYVATINHPEAFRFSPILQFIESAILTVRAAVVRNNCRKVLQFYVCDGEAILSNLHNVKNLYLVLCRDATRFEEKDLLVTNLKHLVSQLEVFVIKHPLSIVHEPWMKRIQDLCNFVHALHMHEMPHLRLLHLPDDVFRCVIGQPSPGVSYLPVMSQLTSLGIWQKGYTRIDRADLLRFMSTCCRELSVLFVFVSGEFKTYLDAFRSLTGLKTLGLDILLSGVSLNGLTFDESEAIHSVADLRIVSDWTSSDSGTRVFKIATFFPNVRAVSVKTAHRSSDPLDLATSLFSENQIFPAVAKPSCFLADETCSLWSHRLMRFLANFHLPEALDLSPCILNNLSAHAGYLRAIFMSMQTNSIKSLLLRGPVHREALSRLQSHITLKGGHADVSAWKRRDLGAQPGIFGFAETFVQTDFKIVGTKTSGSLKGEEFTIRICHQLAKRDDIFD